MKKAEQERTSLLANLGDLNRPLRVRPVRVLGREWWAVNAQDTWPGMVMDLRRLGFEAMAWEEEVLVCESLVPYDPYIDSVVTQEGLKPFPPVHPTIRILRESYSAMHTDLNHLDADEDDLDEDSAEE